MEQLSLWRMSIYRLKIKKKNYKINFKVYDEYDNAKYRTRRVLFNIGRPRIELYDTDNNKVGYVKREREWLSRHYSYAIYVGDKHLTSLDYRISAKIRYNIGINGWVLESSFLQSYNTVTDPKENQIIKISSMGEEKELYIVEYDDKDNEVISVLIFMAIILIKQN